MKLEAPFLQLPLFFDAALLAREIEALGEGAWRPHPQGFPGNSALALVSVDGNPASDAVQGPMRPTPQLLACPYLMQVMHSIGAVWGRSRLMRLSGQAEVMPHVDINYYWREHMRVHVPIVTQPTVRFECGGAAINMASGECWTFDTWRLHRVHNDDDRARIHLVADTVGGPRFWQHMRQARPHDREITGWKPTPVSRAPATPELDYETYNLPSVMSPWEVREHLAFLVGEAQPDEGVQAFAQGVVAPFAREWHALWAKHGDSGKGLDEYRALRDQFRAQLPRFESLRLANGILLVKAVSAIVTSNLVSNASVADVESRDLPGQSAAPRRPSPPAVVPARPSAPAPAQRASPAAVAPASTQPVPVFERPAIILSAPRSGSTLLFETLARAPGLFTIGGESHRAIEGLPGLHPSAQGWESNRLAAGDATPAVIDAVRHSFAQSLRDRDGALPTPGQPVRLLEKTPKNTLRVPFLREVFPGAQFVLLYREPREVFASMIEAWGSGRFRTYPALPQWSGLPWSLLLVPGWRELGGLPLEELVARQWAATVDSLLDDLQLVPVADIAPIRYAEFLANPQARIEQLCARLQLPWDVALGVLPPSRHTLTRPEPDKWRKHEAALARVLPMVEPTRLRMEAFLHGLG